MVVHVYNPSNLGGRNRKIMIGGQPGQKLVRDHLKNKLEVKGLGDVAQVVLGPK
jgi:hypothetical protein